jgi:hypothetical protein
MDDPALEQFIVRELGKLRPRNDLIMMVCERAGVDWNAAQKIVARVEVQKRSAIMGRKRMVVIIFSIPIIIGGLVLFASSSFVLYTAWQQKTIPNPRAIYGFGVSILMILGGTIGIFRVK